MVIIQMAKKYSTFSVYEFFHSSFTIVKTFLCREIRYFIWVWICTLEAEASKLAIKRPRVHTLLVSGIWFRLWPKGKKILFSSYTYVHDVLDDVDVMCSHFKVHNAPFLISNSVSTRFCH